MPEPTKVGICGLLSDAEWAGWGVSFVACCMGAVLVRKFVCLPCCHVGDVLQQAALQCAHNCQPPSFLLGGLAVVCSCAWLDIHYGTGAFTDTDAQPKCCSPPPKKPRRRHLGVLEVQLQALVAAFEPSPRACLAHISELLPVLAYERYTAYIDRVHHATSRLQRMPTSVEEFAEYLEVGAFFCFIPQGAWLPL